MAENKIIETFGSITKVEQLHTIDSNILDNTFVLETFEPFPGYHGENLPSEEEILNSWEEKNLIGKRIGILGKGGSGKSTVAVLLTMALRDQGYHVCLLDADSTNVGLAKALGFDRS